MRLKYNTFLSHRRENWVSARSAETLVTPKGSALKIWIQSPGCWLLRWYKPCGCLTFSFRWIDEELEIINLYEFFLFTFHRIILHIYNSTVGSISMCHVFSWLSSGFYYIYYLFILENVIYLFYIPTDYHLSSLFSSPLPTPATIHSFSISLQKRAGLPWIFT